MSLFFVVLEMGKGGRLYHARAKSDLTMESRLRSVPGHQAAGSLHIFIACKGFANRRKIQEIFNSALELAQCGL